MNTAHAAATVREITAVPIAPEYPAPAHRDGAPICRTPGCLRDAGFDSEGAWWDAGGTMRGGSWYSHCDRCSRHHGYRLHAHRHTLTPEQAAANGGPRSWLTSASMGPVVEGDTVTGYRCTEPLPYPHPQGTACGYTEPVNPDAADLFADVPTRGTVHGTAYTLTPVPTLGGQDARWSVTLDDGTHLGHVHRGPDTGMSRWQVAPYPVRFFATAPDGTRPAAMGMGRHGYDDAVSTLARLRPDA